jgi:hypothetical protein
MTTLKESIEQRRAESRSVRSYELANEPVLSLQIHSWDGEKTVLPWANFNSAGHRSTSAGEQLTLRFDEYEVALQGVRLAVLLPKIASFNLAWVCGQSAEYLIEANKREAFITRVSVHCLAKATDGKSADSVDTAQI